MLRRQFHTTARALKFDLALETQIRDTIARLPAPSKLYKNEDGLHREPSESELKTLALLVSLASQRKVSLLQALTLSSEHSELARSNQNLLEELIPSYANGAPGKIVDKIPYEENGEIKWKFVREGQKEGWEKIMYFSFVPACFLMLGIMMFKPDDGINAWADKELELRVKEDLESQGAEKKDSIILERILAGEYDRLAGLMKAKPEQTN